MQIDGAQSTLSTAGKYEIAVYNSEFDVRNTAIVQRAVNSPIGVATWGMSGCHGVAVFGGHAGSAQVDFIAMFHSSGGLTDDRLDHFLKHFEASLPQPGGNFEWALVISQGDESGSSSSWSRLARHAPGSYLFNTNPAQCYIMSGPAPGGAQNAFAIDLNGHWGVLDQAVNKPLWAVAPTASGSIRVANNSGQSKCCFISTACCQYLGLPDDCDELETLRRYRDDVLLNTQQGRRDVELYYQLAPVIVNQLERHADCEQIYSRIYSDYLVPAVGLINSGENLKAYRVYKALVADLVQDLGVTEFSG